MKKSLWNRQFPTLFAFLILLGGVGISVWFSQTTSVLTGRASSGFEPKNVKITNISDTSFTVSYTTDSHVLGTVSYGTTRTRGQVAFDDRDKKSGTSTPHTAHFMTLHNLKPQTKYYFALISGTNTFLNNSTAYDTTTGPMLSGTLANTYQVNGNVTLPDATDPLEGIVYVATDTSAIVSTVLLPDGSYHLSLQAIRSKNLTSFIPLSDTTKFHMWISAGSFASTVSFLGKQAASLPLISLAQNYDFASGNTENNLGSVADASPSATISFPPIAIPSNKPAPQILAPQKNQGLSDQQPEFQGTSKPGGTVTIEIHSTAVIKTTVKADDNGLWKFRPAVPLTPGIHSITITAPDASGILKTVTQQFTVFASGSQFADPSVSPIQVTPSPAPSVTNTPTPSNTATPMPSLTLSPSPVASASPTPVITEILIPTATPTITPLPTATPLPSATVVPQPVSGSSAGIAVGLMSFGAIIIGLTLFILIRI